MPGAVLVDDNAALAAAMARAIGATTVVRPRRMAGGRGSIDRPCRMPSSPAAVVARTLRGSGRHPGQRRRFAAPSAPLRRLRPLTPPAPVSGPAGRQRAETAGATGRRREVDPLADQLNASNGRPLRPSTRRPICSRTRIGDRPDRAASRRPAEQLFPVRTRRQRRGVRRRGRRMWVGGCHLPDLERQPAGAPLPGPE